MPPARSRTQSTASPPGDRDGVDPGTDLHRPPRRREWRRHREVLPVIAVGGMLGASARYAAGRAWPTPDGGIPWATLAVNAVGCLLIGVLMVFVVEVGGAHPLVRPFVGVGLLGGFTTFSTYAVETDTLLRDGHPAVAAVYFLGTVLVAMVAVTVGVAAARTGVAGRRRWLLRRGGQG